MNKYKLIKIIGIAFIILIVSYGSAVYASNEWGDGSYWWASHGFGWYRSSFWDWYHFGF